MTSPPGVSACREAGDEETGVSVIQTLEDEITRLATIKMSAKIHSFDMCCHGDDNVVKVIIHTISWGNELVWKCHIV